MTGYKIVNLKLLVDEMGEEFAKDYLSQFSCPMNKDVEEFLRYKAIDFSKQDFSQTHLVLASYKEEPVLVGYFTLAYKYITIVARRIKSNTLKKRINKFAKFDERSRSYCLAAPLIAQLGKNYANGYDKLITGDELLKLACDNIKVVQSMVGGRIIYLECEDKPKLIEFYERNGFCEFDTRELDRDETNIDGDYLVQLLKYQKSE